VIVRRTGEFVDIPAVQIVVVVAAVEDITA
jgi:hypothetical protein